MNSIEIKDVSKSYGKLPALSGVSFAVNQGELFGIIGADGAGKTTLFRILTTLILANQGVATVDGFDVVSQYRNIRERVGYMPGRFSLYQDLTVEENLNFFATLFGTTIHQNYDLIRDIYVQIEPFKKRRAGKLSGGMKQKLALCCALIHKPSVLFLDEPTTGVDPVSRMELWQMLRRLKNAGITILVSTPYMDEALLCDRIALINAGRIMTIDTPTDIIATYGEPIFSIHGSQMRELLYDLKVYPAVKSIYTFGDSHHVTFHTPITVEQLRKDVESVAKCDVEVKLIEATIEDCFIKLSRQ